ncbi:MAG TPA: DUF1707 domain-containing protein [Trebonia sp.]|jgi:hypothetical protein|nr:DUF1707 domain-containing protein [Trebonia sp.]
MAMRDNGPLPTGQEGELRNGQARYATLIGDADRDAAAAELGEHYADGRLTLDELHDRLGQVLEARTRGQLLHVMADLPAPRWAAADTTARATPTGSDESRRDNAKDGADNVGQFAAVALLLVAMLIWLFTALLFAHHGYYVHHQYPSPGWQGGWQQQP